MRHQRSNIPVAEMKHSFDNFFFFLFNRAMLASFRDHCLDLFFSHCTVACSFDIENAEDTIGDLREQPYNRERDPTESIHRLRYVLRNFFCPYHPDPFRKKLTDNNG